MGEYDECSLFDLVENGGFCNGLLDAKEILKLLYAGQMAIQLLEDNLNKHFL